MKFEYGKDGDLPAFIDHHGDLFIRCHSEGGYVCLIIKNDKVVEHVWYDNSEIVWVVKEKVFYPGNKLTITF